MELVWSHDWRFLTPKFRILRDCLSIFRERGSDGRDTLWFDVVLKFDFASLDNILVRCPNLRELRIDDFDSRSVVPLMDAYGNGRGPQSLKLRGPKIADEDSVVQFLELLATPTSMLARRLQNLVVDRSLSASAAIHLSPLVIEALARVVVIHTKLQRLKINLTTLEQEMYKRSFEQLVRKSNQLLGEDRVVSKSKAPHAIGAFLSVFEPRNHRVATRSKLNNRSVSLILSIAATAVPRQVIINTYAPSKY